MKTTEIVMIEKVKDHLSSLEKNLELAVNKGYDDMTCQAQININIVGRILKDLEEIVYDN